MLTTEVSSFNVLDRHTDVHKNLSLEASAGTGKTFSIENIVVRLLIEEPVRQCHQTTIDRLLIVTFTRAATAELKARLVGKLEECAKVLLALEAGDISERHEHIPDYLLAIGDQGQQACRHARRRLDNALACFDDAQIFTIHGFCYRMLNDYGFQAQMTIGADDSSQSLDWLAAHQIVRDYFRTGLSNQQFSTQQLSVLLGQHRNDSSRLIAAVSRLLMQGTPIRTGLPYEQAIERFGSKLNELKQAFSITGSGIAHDFQLLAPLYKGTCTRSGELHGELLSAVQQFSTVVDGTSVSTKDFENILENGFAAVSSLDSSKLKTRTKPLNRDSLRHPGVFTVMREELLPIVSEALSYPALLSRCASDCQGILERVIDEQEVFGPDELLNQMKSALSEPSFCHAVQERYRCAIVDEFQDTDPIQWSIFHRLFSEKKQLILVGDPKQSIYAFRNADIYTYLSATKTLGEEAAGTLSTNFRSVPALVTALNTLFSPELCPGLISLPSISQDLPYNAVESGCLTEHHFHDGLGNLIFFAGRGPKGRGQQWPSSVLESEQLFPYLAEEIQRLQKDDGIMAEDCAVLVKDRYQAERLRAFLSSKGINTALQRQASLGESLAVDSLRCALKATLWPQDHSAVNAFLASPFVAWNYHELQCFQENYAAATGTSAKPYRQLQRLRHELVTRGFAAYFQQLLQTCWSDLSQSSEAAILSREDGLDLHVDLCHLAELLVDFQGSTHPSANGLMAFFPELKRWQINDDPRLRRRRNYGNNSVQVMTLHASKGLEFAVVFALGLASRTTHRQDIVRVKTVDGDQLAAADLLSADQQQQSIEEADAEKMRQLYVAMTRARLRLYVPIVAPQDSIKVEKGAASFMELLIARLASPTTDHNGLYQRIANDDPMVKLSTFVDQYGRNRGMSFCEMKSHRDITTTLSSVSTPTPILYPPQKLNVALTPKVIQSFTSLNRKHGQQQQQWNVESTEAANEDDKDTVHQLPAGPDVGIALHTALQTLPWDSLKELGRPEELQELIDKTPISWPLTGSLKGWDSLVVKLLYNAVKTPLPIGSQRFCLADIPAEKVCREMEFLHPYGPGDNDLLKGVIDLAFEYGDRSYLLDWKSNRLGTDNSAYGKEGLRAAMDAHHYTLQAELYRQAWQRYQKLVDGRPADAAFGGVFYLFLRGLDPDSEDDQGIAAWIPNPIQPGGGQWTV